MTSTQEWMAAQLAELNNDPEYLTEKLLIGVTEQIHARMEDEALRPADLARRLGVSRPFVSQLLNGKPNMTMRTLVTVAHALGYRVNVQLQPQAATRSGWRPFRSQLALADKEAADAILASA